MEIGESYFEKNYGKLAHWRNVAPKIIYGYKGVVSIINILDDWS
jgi:hypothetical protein